MTSLHKFKLLATQCAVAGSPTRSPSSSPVIHLRRRKTLRMFLSRNPARRRDDQSNHPPNFPEEAAVRLKLKDFLLSSPPPPQKAEESGSEKAVNVRARVLVPGGGDRVPRGGRNRPLRPLTATLRQRLLRKSWRPVLVSIPE